MKIRLTKEIILGRGMGATKVSRFFVQYSVSRSKIFRWEEEISDRKEGKGVDHLVLRRLGHHEQAICGYCSLSSHQC